MGWPLWAAEKHAGRFEVGLYDQELYPDYEPTFLIWLNPLDACKRGNGCRRIWEEDFAP